jgi:hypothetical protein
MLLVRLRIMLVAVVEDHVGGSGRGEVSKHLERVLGGAR